MISRDLWLEAEDSPTNQGYHCKRNAETYVEIGSHLGPAKAEISALEPKRSSERKTNTEACRLVRFIRYLLSTQALGWHRWGVGF